MKLREKTLLAVLALATIACGPSYGTVEFDAINTPPVGVTVRGFFIEIPAGVAAVVRVRLDSDNRTDYDSSYSVDLFPRDRNVMTVERRPSRREFVLIGNNPGTTCLEVLVEGRSEDCIEVEITEPEGG